jgi:hypothetical protein
MTTYMARSAWTTAARGGSQLTGSKLVGIAVHWPGTTSNAYGVESASKVAARLRGWWDYHVNTRGWSDIGYNMAIDQAGRVWDLRGLSRVGAHCASDANPDANHEWIGVLFVLGDEERPTAEMIRAFQDFRWDVFLPRWPNRGSLTGHGRAPGVPGAQTSCCGPYAAAKILDGTLAKRPSTPTPEPEPEPPIRKDSDMALLLRGGSSRRRLILGDQALGVTQADYDLIAAAGVPATGVSNELIDAIDARLVPEGAIVEPEQPVVP